MCVRVRMRAAAVLTVGRGDLRAVEHGVRAQQLVGRDLVLIGHQPRDSVLVFQEDLCAKANATISIRRSRQLYTGIHVLV